MFFFTDHIIIKWGIRHKSDLCKALHHNITILLLSIVGERIIWGCLYTDTHPSNFIKVSVFHNPFFEVEQFLVAATLKWICHFISLELIKAKATKWRNLVFYLGHRYLANTQLVSYSNTV